MILSALEPVWLGVIIGAAAAAFIGIIVIIAMQRGKNKHKTEDDYDKVKIIDGVRYSNDSRKRDSAGNVNVTHNQGDITLKRGVSYVAKKDGTLLPGKYMVLSASESEGSFNIRLGGLVREVCHGDAIVINDGESITPVSHSIVLR